MKQGQWVDQGTRFISVDFTVYNANINLFCVAKLAFEFPAVGGVLPSQVFTTVKLLKYNNPADYLLMATEFIFILYILYYIVEESLEIKIHGWKYFSNLWNLLDLVVIAVRFLSDFNVLTKMFWFVYLQISLSQIGLNVYNLLKVNSLLKALLAKPFLHADFSPLANSSRQLTILSAVNVFVAWIKVFKYLSFNKTMIQLSETLSGVSQTLLSSTIFWKNLINFILGWKRSWRILCDVCHHLLCICAIRLSPLWHSSKYTMFRNYLKSIFSYLNFPPIYTY